MRKFKNITIGGIQQKIFNLVLITILLMMAAYTAVIIYQTSHLTKIVSDSSAKQKELITSTSEETMVTILESNMTQSTQMEAYIAEDLFGDAISVVDIVADYTYKLFTSPSEYNEREVSLPDQTKNGEITVQLLTEEGVDINDPDISSKLKLIGNLSDLMTAVYKNASVDSCYCALPDGVMLLVDNHSASKFDNNGEIIPIPIRNRLWYKGAVETKKLHFTDVTTDIFTKEISIMCSLPVYVNDELVAVIGADLFLNDISSDVENLDNNGGFVCIVNQNGHVIFSPEIDGIFRLIPAEEARDLRELEHEELARFVNDALNGNTDLRLINLYGEEFYVCGAQIKNVGWAVLSVVPKALADKPSVQMVKELNTIQANATETFNKGMNNAKITITVLLGVIIIVAVSAAILLSKRIIKPLELITQ